MSFNVTLIENPSIKVTLDENPEIKVKILLLKGDKGEIGSPTDAQVKDAVDEWLDDHPEATTTVQDSSITEAKLASDVKAILDNKANIDGYYQNLGVGAADQLVSSVGITDQTPYNFRTSGGSVDIGDKERVDAIVGGTVAINQYALYDESNISNGWAALRVSLAISGRAMTITSIVDASSTKACTMRNFETIAGHKYYLSGYVTPPESYNAIVGLYTSGGSAMDRETISAGSGLCDVSRILSANANSGTFRVGHATTAPSGTVMTTNDIMLIDLTQMFGSTIADYIYSLETATAGAGVAYFRKLFPKSYYDYNAGSLLSVKTSAHKMVGFNQFDEEWELGMLAWATGANATSTTRIRSKNYIPCIGDTVYYVRTPTSAVYLFYYDADKNFISYLSSSKANATFTTPSNARYIRFFTASDAYGTTYNNDICIHLKLSGARDGEYEAYQSWTYTLDSDIELRGIPKLDANNKLYYDGDTYEPDGTATRMFTDVDLGSLSWQKNASHHFYASISVPAKANTADAIMSNGRYPFNADGYNATGFGLTLKNTKFWIYDSAYDDAASLKSSLSGVHLVYRVSQSNITTESADHYQQTQNVDDFGTEEYVDERTIPIPVGHTTFYLANLRDKLQHLPDLANADGYYAIKQVGSQMSLELFRIPKAPTTDGTYTLQATISDGTPTYTWVDVNAQEGV